MSRLNSRASMMSTSSLASRPRPPGGLRPALTPAPGGAHRQRAGAGSNNPGRYGFRDCRQSDALSTDGAGACQRAGVRIRGWLK